MNERATQISLPMSGPVSADVVHACKDMGAAVRLSIQISMLDMKQIYSPLEIDKGQWSRILNGELNFPAGKLEALMDLTGNDTAVAVACVPSRERAAHAGKRTAAATQDAR